MRDRNVCRGVTCSALFPSHLLASPLLSSLGTAMFGKALPELVTSQSTLLVTEPLFNFDPVQEAMDERCNT